MIRAAIPILAISDTRPTPGSRTVPRRHTDLASADDSGDDRGGGRAPRIADGVPLLTRLGRIAAESRR